MVGYDNVLFQDIMKIQYENLNIKYKYLVLEREREIAQSSNLARFS
jgi:hypothetical protein